MVRIYHFLMIFMNVKASPKLYFYFYIQNLLNAKNIINVFPRTGTDNDGFLNDPSLSEKIIEAQGGAGYQALYQEINGKNRQHYLWDYTFRGDDLWSGVCHVGLLLNPVSV